MATQIQDIMAEMAAQGMSPSEVIDAIKAAKEPAQIATAPSPVEAASPTPLRQTPVEKLELPVDDWYYQADELVRTPFTTKITGNEVSGISPSAQWCEKINMILVFNLDEGQMRRLEAGDDSVYKDLKTGTSLANMFAGGVAWPDEFLIHCYPDYADKFSNMRATIKLVFFVEALRTIKYNAAA